MSDLETNRRSILQMTTENLIKHVVSIRSDRRSSIVNKAIAVKKKKAEPKATTTRAKAIAKLSPDQIQFLLNELKEV